MIEVRDTDQDFLGCVFYCDACEQNLGARVEIRYRYKAPGFGRVKAFWKRHEQCGEAELDARIATYGGQNNGDHEGSERTAEEVSR